MWPCVLWPGESCEKCDPACRSCGSCMVQFYFPLFLIWHQRVRHHLKRPLLACAAVCQVVPTQLHPHSDLLPGYILRHIYMWPWHSIKKIHLIRCMESYPKTHCELEDTICAIYRPRKISWCWCVINMYPHYSQTKRAVSTEEIFSGTIYCKRTANPKTNTTNCM